MAMLMPVTPLAISSGYAPMPTPKQQLRRALAYGFKTELLVELVNAELATATIEHMAVGGRRVKVIRMRITAAGRRALSKLRWF